MNTAEKLAKYARTIQGTGQNSNYELCRDAAKSLRECTIARREVAENYRLTEDARLNLLVKYNRLKVECEKAKRTRAELVKQLRELLGLDQ